MECHTDILLERDHGYLNSTVTNTITVSAEEGASSFTCALRAAEEIPREYLIPLNVVLHLCILCPLARVLNLDLSQAQDSVVAAVLLNLHICHTLTDD